MKFKLRFRILTLMLVTALAGLTVVLAMNSVAVLEFFRYGRHVDSANVNWVGINGGALKIEIDNRCYWSEKSAAVRDFNFLSLSGKEVPDIQIDRVWRWSDKKIYLRIEGDVVAANLVERD